MKTVKSILTLLIFCFLPNVNAQESGFNQDTKVQTKHELSYYQQRGIEDAQHEQQFKVKSKAEEREFWKEQKQYEKELRKKNRRAYHAYLQGKKDGYAAHHYHCGSHCNHSNYWYQNAGYYYHGYRQPAYDNRVPRTTVNSQIGVGIPKVRLRVF
ncbi:hypothetical protein [Flavobacterium sandaracinum]|nr:hypothetical protein [Flavobacterium sandaracinum]